MAVSPFASPADRAGRIALQVFCLCVLIFLVTPVVAIIPLSFNAGSFLSYPLAGWSLRWYRELANSPECECDVDVSVEWIWPEAPADPGEAPGDGAPPASGRTAER